MYLSLFFYGTATTEIYTLSLHDALPIYSYYDDVRVRLAALELPWDDLQRLGILIDQDQDGYLRSEEHTSELQSLAYLVCRLLLEKKKKMTLPNIHFNIKRTIIAALVSSA